MRSHVIQLQLDALVETDGVQQLVLDTRDLKVHSTHLHAADEVTSVAFILDPAHPVSSFHDAS